MRIFGILLAVLASFSLTNPARAEESRAYVLRFNEDRTAGLVPLLGLSLGVGTQAGLRTRSPGLFFLGTVGTALVFAEVWSLSDRKRVRSEYFDGIWITLAGQIVHRFSADPGRVLHAEAEEEAAGADSTAAAAARAREAAEEKRGRLLGRVERLPTPEGVKAQVRELIDTASPAELPEMADRVRALEGIERQEHLSSELKERARSLALHGETEALTNLQGLLNKGPYLNGRRLDQLLNRYSPHKHHRRYG